MRLGFLPVDHVVQCHLASFDGSVRAVGFIWGIDPGERRRVARRDLNWRWQLDRPEVSGYRVHSCACYGGGTLVREGVVEGWTCGSVERRAGIMEAVFSAWEGPCCWVWITQTMNVVGRWRSGCGLVDRRKSDRGFDVIWVMG